MTLQRRTELMRGAENGGATGHRGEAPHRVTTAGDTGTLDWYIGDYGAYGALGALRAIRGSGAIRLFRAL